MFRGGTTEENEDGRGVRLLCGENLIKFNTRGYKKTRMTHLELQSIQHGNLLLRHITRLLLQHPPILKPLLIHPIPQTRILIVYLGHIAMPILISKFLELTKPILPRGVRFAYRPREPESIELVDPFGSHAGGFVGLHLAILGALPIYECAE